MSQGRATESQADRRPRFQKAEARQNRAECALGLAYPVEELYQGRASRERRKRLKQITNQNRPGPFGAPA
jgi:hypothetical protein